MVKTPSQRTAEWRAALVEQGYRQKAFFLSPAALDALADLARLHGSELDAVEAALLAAANPPRSEYD